MRITHRHKKEEPKKDYRLNEGITAPEVLVLGAEGEKIGIKTTAEAIRMAREQGLDVVEINPKTTPPVVKIMNFGQFRYHQEKEARLAKARQHVVDTKGVRLSLRIGAHDLDIRRAQTEKFLNGGDKVKLEIFLRGRENQQWQHAIDVMKKFVTDMQTSMPLRIEQAVERNANKITAIIAKA